MFHFLEILIVHDDKKKYIVVMPTKSFMTNIHNGSTDDIRKLSDYLYKVRKAEQESLKRNQKFLSDIEKISNKAETLKEKTDKLKEIRNDYKTYVGQLYPEWQKSEEQRNQETRDTQPVKSIYPEFLRKKIIDWKHDTSLNIPPCNVTPYSPRLETKDSITLLEEQFMENQQQLAELHRAMQKQTELEYLLIQKDQQIKELKKKMQLQNSGQYLGDIENYIPSYCSESRTANPLYTSSPEKQVLPVLNEFSKSFPSQDDSLSHLSSQAPRSIKILPQLLAVTPSGQLMLLPMTNPLDTTVPQHERFSSMTNPGEHFSCENNQRGGNLMKNTSSHESIDKLSPIQSRNNSNSPVAYESFSKRGNSVQFSLQPNFCSCGDIVNSESLPVKHFKHPAGNSVQFVEKTNEVVPNQETHSQILNKDDRVVNQNSFEKYNNDHGPENLKDYDDEYKEPLKESFASKKIEKVESSSEGKFNLENPPLKDSKLEIVSPVKSALDANSLTEVKSTVHLSVGKLSEPVTENFDHVAEAMDGNKSNLITNSNKNNSNDNESMEVNDCYFINDKNVGDSIFSDFSDQNSDFELPSVGDDNIPPNTKLKNFIGMQNNNNLKAEVPIDDLKADSVSDPSDDVVPHVENDYDESISLYLLENVMERVNDQTSDEVLVLNLERNEALLNTVLGVADIKGDLTKFNASEICMAFTYQLEQTMARKTLPFITGDLDETNDFEGHLRDCISPEYLDIWDALFAFISTIMELFEFHPSQVAAIYAFALSPSDRKMSDQLHISLTNILSANIPDSSVKETDEPADEPADDVTDGKASSVSMTETFEIAGNAKRSYDKTKKSDVNISSPMYDDGASKSKENRLTAENLQSLETNKNVPKKSEDDSSSTMSFDSDGLPVPKSKNSVPLDLDKEDLSHMDFEFDQQGLSRSSSAYVKMREESLMSPVHEDSDDLEDALGESLRVKKIKKQKVPPSYLCSSEDILNLEDKPQKDSKETVSPVKSSVDVKSPLNVKSPASSTTEVVLKKPGFWDHSDSESEFDINTNTSQHELKDKKDDDEDDFDFDFYD